MHMHGDCNMCLQQRRPLQPTFPGPGEDDVGVQNGRYTGLRFVLETAFPALVPVARWSLVLAYSGGSAGDLHPSSLLGPEAPLDVYCIKLT